MKKSIIYVFLMTAAALSSCDKFLDSHPKDFLNPDNYYTKKENLDAGLMGVYTHMSTRGSASAGAGYTIYGEENMPYKLVVSDLEWHNTTTPANYVAIFSFTSSDQNVAHYWRALYVGISRANSFIDAIESAHIPGVSEEYKNAAVGEAYFLRGFYYWHLAANFGGVPLRTTYNPEVTHIERASLKDVYEQILKDLEKAEGMVYDADYLNLPTRVTKTTVQAMLSRVCLYMAGEPLNETAKYREALEWARKVKQSGLHTLNPSYEDLFTRMINDSLDLDYRESMFEVAFYGVDSETPRTEGKFGGVNGINCKDPAIGFTYPQIRASTVLENYYLEDPDDTRYAWSVPTYHWGTVTSNATKLNMNFGERYPGKYRKEVCTGPKGNNYTSTNFPVMRYADVLLMLAEAANEVDGPTNEAFEALNEVRQRAEAKLCANAADPEKIALTTKEDFREFIKKERARELCFECTRRLDLVRWGDLVNNVQYMSSLYTTTATVNARRAGNNIAEKHVLMPIPSIELNSNKLMKQNPGW